MENKDFSNILIKDTGFYLGNMGYANVLKKYNIETVDQILDKNITTPILEKLPDGYTKRELISLIKLIECKYLNIPLKNDEILNKKIETMSLDGWKNIIFHFDDGSKMDCYELFLEICLHNTVLFRKPNFDSTDIYLLLKCEKYKSAICSSKLSVIDLIKMMVNDLVPNRSAKFNLLLEILKANVSSYEIRNSNIKEENNELNNLVVEPSSIEILKGELTELIKISETLNIKIEDLKNKIEILEKNIKK